MFEEIIPEMFPTMGKETDIQAQGTQKFPNKMNAKRSSPRHIIMKIIKHQEKTICCILGKPHKVIGRFFWKNFTGQGVARHILNTEIKSEGYHSKQKEKERLRAF